MIYYDLSSYKGAPWTGPLALVFLLIMVACFLLAILRAFGPTGNTILTALPLALGVAQTLWLMPRLIPPIDKAIRGIPAQDLDAAIFGTLLDIRMLLTFGLLFSIASFLAILLRRRCKATA